MRRESAGAAQGDGALYSDAGAGRKRRPSAYILFCVDRRPSVAAEGLSFGDITRALSVPARAR